MSDNKNHKGRARRVLAYFFSAVTGGYFVVQAVGKVLWGIDMVVPVELIAITMAFVGFYVGAEVVIDRD